MSAAKSLSQEELQEILKRSAGLLLAVAVLQVLLGAAAILVPQVATVVGVEFLAVMLCISAIAQGFFTTRVSGWKGTSLLAVGALVSLAVGILILMDPMEGAVAITLLVAISCGVEGVSRIALGSSEAGASSRGALLVSGFAGVIVSGLLIAQWPGDAVWAIGLLMGINLFMGGMALAGMAMAARKSGPEPARNA